MAIHLGRRATPVRQIVAVVAGLCVALVIMFWQDAWTDPSEFLQLGISGLRDRAQYAAVGWDNRKDPRLEDVERDALNLEEVFGKRFFQRSVSYGGTRTRLRQVLRKVLRGEPIRIGYLGGSITAGAGVGSVAPQKYLWPGQVLRLLNETFPNAENEVNGAGIGGLGSVYFAWCGAESLAEDADIIILEHTVNNDGLRETSMAYEEELRAMLSRPNRPAVIGLECFQMVNLYGDGGVNAGALHRYYDAPYLSLKTALLPEVIAHPGRIPEFFGRSPVYADGFANIDLGHYTLRGHYAMGSIVSHFILDEVKTMFAEQAVESDPEHHEGNDEWDRYVLGDKDAGARFDQASFDAYVNDIESWRDERMWGSELYYSDIPRVRMFESFNWDAETPLPQPRCESLAGSKKKIEFESIDPGVKLNDDGSPSGETGAGWQEWKAEASFLDKSYIRTTSRGAIVRIKVQVSGQGEVMLQYLRSNTFGLGKVGCWVDDNKSVLTILDGQWDIPHNLGSSGTVAKGLAAGEHHLHCQLIEGKEFRIIALMTR